MPLEKAVRAAPATFSHPSKPTFLMRMRHVAQKAVFLLKLGTPTSNTSLTRSVTVSDIQAMLGLSLGLGIRIRDRVLPFPQGPVQGAQSMSNPIAERTCMLYAVAQGPLAANAAN